MDGRRGAAARWIEWASSNRTTDPLVWVHAASVGESLTAIPVVERLKTRIPGVQIVHSFTSPSCVSWYTRSPADMSDYLPLDEPKSMAQVLDAVKPCLVICSRGDLWPEMALASVARDIPLTIISGTVRPGSIRLRRPARYLLRPMYKSVTWLGAASDGDASRWTRLGISEDAIDVTGDTRHDQVLERVLNLQPFRPLITWAHGHAVLAAGSTNAQDERILIAAFSRVSASAPNARFLLIPHECSTRRISEVQNVARSGGVDADVWSGESSDPTARCVIVNMMGVLADIYALSQMAYVGGGFQRGGLHAVSEPAAFAVPVIVGPNYECSSDADLVVAAGGGKALPKQGATDLLAQLWLAWLEQDDARVTAGFRARSVLQQGASDTTVNALLQLLDRK